MMSAIEETNDEDDMVFFIPNKDQLILPEPCDADSSLLNQDRTIRLDEHKSDVQPHRLSFGDPRVNRQSIANTEYSGQDQIFNCLLDIRQTLSSLTYLVH